MSYEPHQDSGTHSIRRKPPPQFPYSTRYPEPDPNDPFAPLAVLRDRTATLTNSAYDSPIATIQDLAPGATKVHDLATFIVQQRKKSAAPDFQFGENSWLGHASQLRKGASLGLGLHENPPGEAPTTTAFASTTLRPGATWRRESRRRSQSAFGPQRSSVFSFLESPAGLEPQFNVDSPVSRRHSQLPYDSRTSVLTSSSTSSSGESTNGLRQASKASVRPRSCSSSFVTATLLDGVPEFPSDAVLVHKSMRVMQVDMPTPRVAGEGSGFHPSRTFSPPPPLERRSPSESSIGSWSRDLTFYPASSRPQTPSSVQSSRPLPPSTHQKVSTVATSLPPGVSKSRRVSTPPEDLDALPLHLNVCFPKQQPCVESEPESVERENGRFARPPTLPSTGLQAQRISASSSLRSTLQAAADAAEMLASLDAPPVPALPPATTPAVTQAQPTVAENVVTSPVAETALELKERAQVQPGIQAYAAERHSRAASPFLHQNANTVPPTARNQGVTSARPALSRPVPKSESEPTPVLKHRPLSRSSHRFSARRSTSTPLPISRPLPSPPTVTNHSNPEPVAKSPPSPPPRAHGHGLTNTQVQHALPTPSPPTHSASSSRVVHAPPSTSSHASLPAGAAPPRVPHSAHPFPPSQASNLPPPPPPRHAHTIPLSSRMVYASSSSVVQSASSSSSQVDSLSTSSVPHTRRRDASPSPSSHGRQSPHTSERHGHQHHHHPYHGHHGHPRSLSEPGAPGTLSSTQLANAARLPVVRENGVRVQFGELWRTQRTVVIFIRHFWYARTHASASFLILLGWVVAKHAASRRCPLCQDYLASVMRDADHAALLRCGVRLIVIGCGSYGLIRSYRRACPPNRVKFLMVASHRRQRSSACPTSSMSTHRQARRCTAHSAWAMPHPAHTKRAQRPRAVRRGRTCVTAP